MRLEGRRRSENVEDRRGGGGGGKMIGGGLGTIVILIILMLLGVDPRQLLDSGAMQGGPAVEQTQPSSPQDEKLKQFVEQVLAGTEDVWGQEFAKRGMRYENPKLVLFTGQVRSGCGFASAQVGPFYCPADRTVYLDLSFFRELDQRFGAAGDFAQAYVIAHEVGHHVQNLLGISSKVSERQQQVGEAEANRLSVRLELQADYLAGMWARQDQEKFKSLEPGDIEEGLRAANAIGDDTLQKQAQGRVVPDAFTHGTSDQRVRWFRKGFENGSLEGADTFNVPDL